MGTPQFRWEPTLDQTLTALHAERLSFGLIQQRIKSDHGVDVSRNAVIGRARRLGLPPRDRVAASRKENKAVRSIERRPRMVAPPESMTSATPVPADPSAIRYLTFDELESGDCRFPFGQWPFIAYCGRPNLKGRPYCAEHSKAAYLPLREVRR